ncbi:MAG: 2-amino-4-hydroxy-6-hydroxymethyldihydropteridine diphosphokinase [Lentisphaerae bacterium]|jgi:2-amino-4-hydroxy-6-hydroxymethyldihydropteridine diphosphokinase|nr:2-amino-4-hydroxy-6-hydroxymethyldihydropteridine diphosphokinase [Lentisphaerota bacterium]MBT4818886.1 2-amino-4-hydroxy-6-hydroxymethyldihydropteridine diphosphokinase [Lentisphaerota bacterium]MBT5610167.1 2-amino-4-hydroxy-6-hydroxymethyldihydropteridine diphosphokinase [Lentisphaerota bacterium]MBT7057100.1 2-amino-4-hydroxy-6-hydroxymethyldihydropteridine diphosphokinase [Lentisphaerota bacterium]MBT7846177.1 2-amino-4-hydroxy-6-hydroxymethyldihydropteridine diphosphokinase [Lentispha
MTADQPVCAYVAYGSNIEPEEHVFEAFELLRRAVHVTGVSTAWWTPAIDRPEDPPFVNGVWRVETALPPRPFKDDVLAWIEDRLGRVRLGDPFAPRTIDLDLILHGHRVVNAPGLRLPHPDIARAFVALPVLELNPDLLVPGTGERLRQRFADGQSTPDVELPSPGEPNLSLTHKMREALTDEH